MLLSNDIERKMTFAFFPRCFIRRSPAFWRQAAVLSGPTYVSRPKVFEAGKRARFRVPESAGVLRVVREECRSKHRRRHPSWLLPQAKQILLKDSGLPKFGAVLGAFFRSQVGIFGMRGKSVKLHYDELLIMSIGLFGS